MTPLAHVAGIPVEETALSFGPVLLAGGGLLARGLLARAFNLRRHLRRPGDARRLDREGGRRT